MPNKLIIVLLLLLTTTVWSKTYRIPEDDPIARVEIPNEWKAKEHGESLEATAPDGSAHVLAWPVEGRKTMESVGEALRYIRRFGTVKIDAHSEKRETRELKGRQLRIFAWDAKEREKPIKISCHIFPDLNDKKMLIVFWGSPEADEKHRPQLEQILGSVDTP